MKIFASIISESRIGSVNTNHNPYPENSETACSAVFGAETLDRINHDVGPRRNLPRSYVLFSLILLLIYFFPQITLASISAPATSTGTFSVSWTASSGGLMRAYLYESTNDGPWVRYTVTGENSKTFSKPEGIYTYKLRICLFEPEIDREICNPYTNEVTVVVTTAQVPGVPGSLGPNINNSTGNYVLSWNAATGVVTRYELHERVGETGDWLRIHNSNTRSKQISHDDGVYFYRVRACNNAGCGGFTANKRVAVLKIPGVPGSLGPDVTVNTYYVISWSAASGTVHRYELNERKDNASWNVVHNAAVRSKVFQNKPVGTYNYKARACNANGCSGFTSTKRVVVQLAHTIFGPTQSTGRYVLSWSGQGDEAELQERRHGGTWNRVFKGIGRSSQSFIKVSFNSEGVYQYRLRFCIPPEPGFDGFCYPWGAIHSVLVDHPTNVSLTAASIQGCSGDQLQQWQIANNHSLGVLGLDPVGHRIGPSPAYRTGLGMNWYPVDVFKQNFCGTLHRFNYYDPWGDEADWNNFIIPNDHYGYILEDVLPLADGDDVHDCARTDDCLEAEITPDQAFYEFPWFRKSTDSSWLRGAPLCTYGAWVWEEAHGNRPEIHPSELYWWKANPNLTYLLMLQEDSNRFDRQGDFAVSSPVPSWWRPWSAYPRTGQFNVAFEITANGTPVTYDITDSTTQGVWKRHVVTPGDPRWHMDADDGKEHAIQYEGNTLLMVNELQQNDDELGVRFKEVCRDPQNASRIQGYISIQSKVGINDRGGEGYHFLQVERREGAQRHSAQPKKRSPSVILQAETKKKSLRRIGIDGSPILIVDVAVKSLGDPAIERSRLNLKKAILNTEPDQRDLKFEPTLDLEAGQIKGVPVIFGKDQSARLDITMESGDVVSLKLAPIELAPRIADTPLEITSAPTAWRAVRKAVSAEHAEMVTEFEVVKVGQWAIDVAPGYSVIRDGAISREDDSPVAEKLNEVITRSETTKMEELWGTARPFQVNWKFQAINVIDGKTVPVKVNSTGEKAIAVTMIDGKARNSSIVVVFPKVGENDLYKLVVTAEMTDTLGNISSVQHTLWSHIITADTQTILVDGLLRMLALELGVSVSELQRDSQLLIEDNAQTRKTRFRRARMLRLMCLRAAEDMRVTMDELTMLTKTARSFHSAPN